MASRRCLSASGMSRLRMSWCKILGQHALATGDFFELFVGSGHAVAAHDGLDGFGQHFQAASRSSARRSLSSSLFQPRFASGSCRPAWRPAPRQRCAARSNRSGSAASGRWCFSARWRSMAVGQAQVALGVFKVDGRPCAAWWKSRQFRRPSTFA